MVQNYNDYFRLSLPKKRYICSNSMILLDEFLQIADVSIEEYQPPKYAGVGESYNVIFHSFRYLL